MGAAFETVFKKAVDANKKVLHSWGEKENFEFIYAFLGQNDSRLDAKPANFITRDQVNTYPTDFAAMSNHDISRLTKRGEQVMDILIDMYGKSLLPTG
jgi:NTE family protein